MTERDRATAFRDTSVRADAAALPARLSSSLSGTNLVRAGDYNQRVVLQAIRLTGAVTRNELARTTGLTQPTIANIVKRLIEQNYVVDAGRSTGGRGMPAQKLTINADGCFGIGINIDRDHVTVVSLDLAGQVRTRATKEVAFAGPEQVRCYVAEEIAAMHRRGAFDMTRILGVGVAMPSGLGRVPLPHLPAEYAVWNTVDVTELLQPVAPWPILVDNDAAAAAIGEMQFGLGRQHRSFVYMLISVGLGGGVVIDGSYYRGSHSRSGRVGFIRIGDGRILQDVVSLSALFARFEAAGLTVESPACLDGASGEASVIIDQWIAHAAAVLVEPLRTIDSLVDPDAILIGGRLPSPLIERLATAVNALLRPDPEGGHGTAPVLRAELAADAPAVGAAIMPFSRAILPSDSILMVADPFLP